MSIQDRRNESPADSPGEIDEEALGQAVCQRVRELRKRRGWTLEELSAACGVSRSMLSEIERGRANPTLVVAYRIARAFGMTLGELVDIPGAAQRIQVIRADDRTYHYRSDRHCRIRTLSPLHLEKSVEFYEIVLRAGGSLKSGAHFEGASELITVQRGKLRVRAADEVEELDEGDSAHYPADVPHSLENAGDDDVVVFLVVTYP
jgi:transcriptional regulator with XRE-family HTH domain